MCSGPFERSKRGWWWRDTTGVMGSYCTGIQRGREQGACQVWCHCAVQCIVGSALRCSGVAMVTSSDDQSWK